MDTLEIQSGSLVEVIRTGVVICVLKYLSSHTSDNESNARKSLKLTKFLGDNGEVYGMDEVRILPNNAYV